MTQLGVRSAIAAGLLLSCNTQPARTPVPTTIIHIPAPPEQAVKPTLQRQTLPRYADTVACDTRQTVNVLAGLNPVSSYDYGEVRVAEDSKASFSIASRYGTRCGSSKHPARCQEWYQIQDADTGFALAADSYQYLVFTGGDHAWQVNTNADLLEFLGPIDTPNEALLLAWLEGYTLPTCDELGTTLTPVAGGYLFYSPAPAEACHLGFNRTRLRVNRNGTIDRLGDIVDPRRPSCGE